jgi:hypothetical protein
VHPLVLRSGAWLAASALLGAGCNLILGTEAPVPTGGTGGTGGSTTSSTSASSSSESSSSGASSTTAASSTSASSSTAASSSSSSASSSSGAALACGDDGWAHWNPDAARTFTQSGANQLVADSLTGLTWEGYSTQNNPLGYAAAQAYCAGLSVDVLTTGWRLPTRVEALSIIDYAKVSPAVDATYFHNVLGAPYWSTSDYVALSGPAKKWVVWLGDGSTSNDDPVSDTAWVRCVNGAPPAADPACVRYTLTNGTATDKETGLIWQRNAASGQATLAAATAACLALSLEQHTWRLPRVEELATLVDQTPANPSDPRFDKTAFPFLSEPNGYYWAITDFAASPANTGWNVGFFDGVITTTQKSASSFYRCVTGP